MAVPQAPPKNFAMYQGGVEKAIFPHDFRLQAIIRKNFRIIDPQCLLTTQEESELHHRHPLYATRQKFEAYIKVMRPTNGDSRIRLLILPWEPREDNGEQKIPPRKTISWRFSTGRPPRKIGSYIFSAQSNGNKNVVRAHLEIRRTH